MRFIKVVLASAVGYFLAAAVVFILIFMLVAGLASSSDEEVYVPSNSVLSLQLNYPLQDRVDDSGPFAALAVLDPNNQLPLGLNSILQTIEQAKTDDKIKGIVLDLTTVAAGYAKLSEVRNKLASFKESGKFIYAYADYYYYPTYYLASVADSIFINPEGEMSFTGMVAQVSFFAGALEKLGVEVQAVRAGKFKGAVEAYTRKNLSPENREQIEVYINSVYDETLKAIAANRPLTVEQLKEDANSLKLNSVAAFQDKGYIDALVYRDQFYAQMKTRMGLDTSKKVRLISEQKYVKTIKKEGDNDQRVAVIYAGGDIVGGKGDGTQIAADDMAATLKSVRKNKKIKSVVLRIDSRGGSSLASDIIWREAKLLAAEKPLIVSMGDVAASGGYYIATPAEHIFAEATTITGSIGVFGLVPNAQKLLNDKMGLEFEYVGTSKHSDIGRIDRPMTEEERSYIGSVIDRIYTTFLGRVAEGRGISTDSVHQIAQGRVWTGVMAKEVGLVDELGGLEKAIAYAAEAAELQDYMLQEFPKVKEPIEVLINKMQGSTSLKAQTKAALEGTGFESYINQLGDLQRWGTQQSIQAIMPYDIKVQHFSFK